MQPFFDDITVIYGQCDRNQTLKKKNKVIYTAEFQFCKIQQQ
jgi:hypothetical protein